MPLASPLHQNPIHCIHPVFVDVALDDMLADLDGGLDINPEPFPCLDRFASLGLDLERQPDFVQEGISSIHP